MDLYDAMSYVNRSSILLKESSAPAPDAAEIFGYIKGLVASEAFTYEDGYKLLKILTGAVIDLLQKGSENESSD